MLVTYAAVGWLRGRQDTRTPLLVAAVSALVNLVLEIVLILGLGYGVGASAASTVLVQWGAVAVYLAGLGRQASALRVGLRPVGRAVGRLARVGLDLLVRTVALRLALAAATVVAARLGAAQVGAHQIAFELLEHPRAGPGRGRDRRTGAGRPAARGRRRGGRAGGDPADGRARAGVRGRGRAGAAGAA